jgi:hypothetical protein
MVRHSCEQPDLLEPREEKARHGMPGLGRDKKVGRPEPPTPRRLFRRNDVWPVVVGLDVSFVLAGREELR